MHAAQHFRSHLGYLRFPNSSCPALPQKQIQNELRLVANMNFTKNGKSCPEHTAL